MNIREIIDKKRYELIEKVENLETQKELDYVHAQKVMIDEIEEELDA